MKFIHKFSKFILKENKENDENTTQSSKQESDFSNEILNEYSFKKIDYYYLDNKIDENIIKEMYDLIDDNEYRAFATFSDNIKHFEEMPCTLIALVNYPPERFNKRTIIKKIDEVKNISYIDEIEFPWDVKYLGFGVDFWRDIIVELSNLGIKLRPMVEFGIYSDDDIKLVIEFFKKINIMSIMTSSGLYSEMTTLNRWNEIKDLIPNKWEVKIGGVLTIDDINQFIKSDVDLAATTISLKSEYGEDLGLE